MLPRRLCQRRRPACAELCERHSFYDIKKLRAQALYDQDKSMPLRKSHLNPVLQKCYEEFLGEPGSHKAHEILHTSYVKRGY